MCICVRSDPLVGSSNLPSRMFLRTFLFFFCSARGAELWWFWGVQTDEALRSHDSSVHSTRVVFIPSKDKIRVRVPMDAHGGLLYMVAYNLRKVENRDRYPDPPVAYYRRNSLVAGLRVVAAAAWVRFPVSAIPCFSFCLPL